ncbi:MAG TPA: glycosyltransferase family 2 protein [Caulobacter sp.]|nr:glycosyltransferase family 2 protein [Caulobacter sp.]
MARLDHENLDIIVCDNASGDGSFETIRSGLAQHLEALNRERAARTMRPFALEALDAPDAAQRGDAASRRLWVVQTGRNGGYAAGNNVGIRLALHEADVEHVWILNNDTLVAGDSLMRLLERMAQDPAIGICGAKVVYLESPDRVQALGGGHFLRGRARCELIGMGSSAEAPVDAGAVEAALSYVNGAAALVRRTLIETVGYMDEGYFLYWEEIDWATRAAGRFRLGYCDAAKVYHRVGMSIGTSDDGQSSMLAEFYLTRSKFRFLRLHHPGLLILALPNLARAVVRELIAGRRARARNLLVAAVGGRFQAGAAARG